MFTDRSASDRTQWNLSQVFAFFVYIGAVIEAQSVCNIYIVHGLVYCVKCTRKIGNVLHNGNIEIFNTRLLTYETIQHNFDSKTGREVLFQRVSERRSLLGKFEPTKRSFIEQILSGFQPSTEQNGIELNCFRVEVPPKSEIGPVEGENLPLIVDEESDSDDYSSIGGYSDYSSDEEPWAWNTVANQRHGYSYGDDFVFNDNDAFFNQETVPFPFHLMQHDFPEIILPDYESLSYDSEWQNYSPPNVYHNNEEIYRLNDRESILDFPNRPNSLSSDNFSDLQLSDPGMDSELVDFCMDYFVDIANNMIVCDSSLVEDEIEG